METLAALTTKIVKWIDYNPFIVVALIASALLVGCDVSTFLAGKTVSPFTGESVTAAQLQAEYDAEIEKQVATQAEATLAITQAEAAFEAAIAAATLEAEAADAAIARATDRAEAAIEEANAKTERNAGLIEGLLTFTGSAVPGLGPLIPLLLAGGLGVDNIRRAGVIRKLKRGTPE